MRYDRLDRPPFGRAWDRYWPAPRNPWLDHQGPYAGWRIDADEWDYIEHIRMHGRLPGHGTLEAWDVTGWRAPVIEPAELVLGASRRVEKHSRLADRHKAAFLNPTELERLAVINAHNEAAAKAARRSEIAKRLKYAENEKLALETLAAERRAWRAEAKRWARSALEREERWQAEAYLWRDVEQRERRWQVRLMRRLQQEQARARETAREAAKARRRDLQRQDVKRMRKLWVARHLLAALEKHVRATLAGAREFYDDGEIKLIIARALTQGRTQVLAPDFHGWERAKSFE